MKYYILILSLFSFGVFAANTRIFYEETIFTKDVTMQQDLSVEDVTANTLGTFGTVGVGGTPDSSAMFDVVSTSLGSLPYPQINTSQMNNINTPANGLLVYNTTELLPYFYNGSVWQGLLNAGSFAVSTNTLSTTGTNEDLILSPNGTGKVDVQKALEAVSLGVGGAVDSSSLLDVTSTTKGSKPYPSMTTAQRDAITSPQAGLTIYNSDTNQLNQYNGTSWVLIAGSGGDVTVRNYVENPTFDTSDDDVTVTANITKSQETSTPIADNGSLKLTIATAATTADYADIDLSTFAKADTDTSKPILISFEYYNDSNFSTDDVQFVLRNNTDSEDIIPLGDLNGKIQYSENTTKYVGYVQTDAGITDYSLRMNVLSAPSTASNIVIDTVKVGPDSFTAGAIVKKSQTYTPIWTGSSTNPSIGNGTLEGSYAQVGNLLYVEIYLSIGSTTTTGSGFWEFSLPSGYAIDSTAVSTLRGWTQYNDADTTGNRQLGTVFANTSNNYIRPVDDADGAVGAAAPFTWATNDILRLQTWIPIEGEASTLISSTDALLRSASLIVGGTPTSTLSGTATDIVWPTVEKDKLNIYNNTTGEITIPKDGIYLIAVQNEQSATATSTSNTYGIELHNNTTSSIIMRSRRNPYSGSGTVVMAPKLNTFFEASKDDVITVKGINNATSPSYVSSYEGQRMALVSFQDLISAGVYPDKKLYTSVLTTSDTTTSDDTWIDVTGSSIEIGPGEHELTYSVPMEMTNTGGSAVLGNANIAIFDSDNNLIPKSTSLLRGSIIASGTYGATMSRTVKGYVTSEPITLKLRVRKAVATAISTRVSNFTGSLTDEDAEAFFQIERQ